MAYENILFAIEGGAARRHKQAILASPHNTLAQQLGLERDLMREMGGTRDYAEGVSAFLEKRPARFTGE